MLHLFFLLIRDRAEAVLSGYKQCHSAIGHFHCLPHCRGGRTEHLKTMTYEITQRSGISPVCFVNQMYNIDCRCLS